MSPMQSSTMSERMSYQYQYSGSNKTFKGNKLNEAGKMLFENNPLTTVCSLVCNHEKQCEGHCVLGRKGAPVHFHQLKITYQQHMQI